MAHPDVRLRRGRPPGFTGSVPSLEGLEDRTLLTILFTPQQGAEVVHDYGGPKLCNASGPGTPIYLIFWGSYWAAGSGQMQIAADVNAVDPVLYQSGLLDGLSEYGSSYRAFAPGGTWAVEDYTNPGSTVSDAQIQAEVDFAINHLGLPDADAHSNTGIYYVITAPGVTSSTYPSFGGYHGPSISGDTGVFDHIVTRYYGWLRNDYGTPSQQIDTFTYRLSHETMESFTDPDVNLSSGIIVTSDNAEICDAEAQGYTALLNGFEVQSFWSAAFQKYEISDGNNLEVIDNGGDLIVNGTNSSDTFTVDVNSRGGVLVGLDGQSFLFMPNEINRITLNTDGAGSTVDVYNTLASAPVTINSGYYDSVNLGNPSDGVQGINGSVNVLNPSYYTDLSISDFDNNNSRRTVSEYNNAVYGLAPAAITYDRACPLRAEHQHGHRWRHGQRLQHPVRRRQRLHLPHRHRRVEHRQRLRH